MTIQNQEHIEAAQAEQNKINDDFRKSLSPEENKKFEAVSGAMKILSDAQVPCLMFPMLPSRENKNMEVAYQYNNMEILSEYVDGKMTEQTKNNVTTFNVRTVNGIFLHLDKMIFRGLPFNWDQFCYNLNLIIKDFYNCKPIVLPTKTQSKDDITS